MDQALAAMVEVPVSWAPAAPMASELTEVTVVMAALVVQAMRT